MAELEGELAAVEERVSLLILQIEEKMPLYKQVNPCNAFFRNLSKMPPERTNSWNFLLFRTFKMDASSSLKSAEREDFSDVTLV